MIHKVFVILFLSFFCRISATVCVERTFKEKHLNIYLCQNYSNYNETRSLLFETRAKILNEYIGTKIIKGELQNKKFEIQLHDPVLTYQHLHISQGKNAYFISYSGFATIQQLKTFIDYFAHKNWRPFFTSDYQLVSKETISKQIDNFFLENKTYGTGFTQQTVWTLDELRLDYINDTLRYYINAKPLIMKATSSLPVKIGERFLLFQSDAIFVLQGDEIIKTLKITKPITDDYDIYTYKKWVNICNGGRDHWIYSYSYDENKFYKRKD